MSTAVGLDFVPDYLDLDMFEVTFADAGLFVESFSPASEDNDEEEGSDAWCEREFESWDEPHPVARVTMTGDGKYVVCAGVATRSGGDGWEPTGPRRMCDDPKTAAWWAKLFS